MLGLGCHGHLDFAVEILARARWGNGIVLQEDDWVIEPQSDFGVVGLDDHIPIPRPCRDRV
jgi:hypothetical protein